ncbi:MAG TPA: AAA family ATPase [Candidatus Nanoarchaeia archaeon]|nr:AAA family ATPase [Candidatus Nanoarchaeia archaeon]
MLDLFSSKKTTLVYGKGGSGKTTLAMMLARDTARRKQKTLFLDTEQSFSVERFKQMAPEDYEQLLDNILIIPIKSFREQQDATNRLATLLKKGKFGLIVVDSLTRYYRTLVKNNQELANSMLKSQLRILKSLSKDIQVLLTTQVSSSLKENKEKPTGGKFLDIANTIIYLQRDPRILANQTIKEQFPFEIKDEGIVLL